jgi:propionyl-CoA carboxylase alpha chain
LLDHLAAIAAFADHRLNERKRKISGQMRAAVPVRFDRRRVVETGTHRLIIEIADHNHVFEFYLPHNGKTLSVESEWKPGQPVFFGKINGKPVAAQIRAVLNGIHVAHAGVAATLRVFTEREAELHALMPPRVEADTGKALLCPMPGLVRSIAVKETQEVKAGEILAIVEAMKMENVLRAERDGKISKIHAKEGDSLAVDAVILEFA